jgi:AraC-like DNA-binding protein
VRHSKLLGAGPGFSLDAVTCVDDHRGWSPTEVSSCHRVVLVRRGTFRRMADGRAAVADPTMAYLGLPGQEEHFAHPAGGDVCTSLSLSPELWRTLAGDDTHLARPTLYVDAHLDLAHRRFLRAARDGDTAFGLTECLLSLVATALRQVAHTPATSPTRTRVTNHASTPAINPGRTQVTDSASTPAINPTRTPTATVGLARPAAPPTAAGLRRPATPATPAAIADAAREAISADHPAAGALLTLAELLAVSPYQLSRAFTRELGISLTHYRNRVRVGRALDRLEGGATSLAALAADLGFADQAHLTRTIRRHVGHAPTALRRLLASPGDP